MQIFFARMALPILLLHVEYHIAIAATDISVWPLPSDYSSGNKVLWIAYDVKFRYKTSTNIVTLPLSPNLQTVGANDPTLSGEQFHLR